MSDQYTNLTSDEQAHVLKWKRDNPGAMTFGEHEGRAVRSLVWEHPDYIRWLIDQKDLHHTFLKNQRTAARYVQRFDAKAILVKCSSPGCANQPNQYTIAYTPSSATASVSIKCWCGQCTPVPTPIISALWILFRPTWRQ